VNARLRVVVADDERPARSFLAALLRSFDDVVIVAEAESGAEAVTAIERERPDLALLDLQMPEVDGIGVVRMLKKDRMPLIAFVTAYDEYAVRAFEINAVDYLLKPVEKTRLRETLNRAQERIEHAEIVADGEFLYVTTIKNDRHTITHRLKDLEARLDPSRFIRLGRGTLANIDAIVKVNVMPGGTHLALLSNGQKLQVSRLQSRIIRERLLRL